MKRHFRNYFLIILFISLNLTVLQGLSQINDSLARFHKQAERYLWFSSDLQYNFAVKYFYQDPESAFKLAQKLEQQGIKKNDIRLVAQALRLQGMYYANSNDVQKGIQFIGKSITLLKQTEDEYEAAISTVELGNIYSYNIDVEKGLLLLNNQVQFFEERKDTCQLANVFTCIADIQKANGMYLLSIDNYNKALKLYIAINHEDDENYIYNEIAGVYKKIKQYRKALEYYNRVLNYTYRVSNKNGTGAALNNIADLYNSLKEYKLAINYFEKALVITKQSGLVENIAIVYNNIGKAHANLKNNEMALQCYFKGLSALQNKPGASIRQNIFLNIADIYCSIGNVVQCSYYLKKYTNLTNDKETLLLKAKHYEIASLIEAINGNHRTAYALRLQYENLSDSIRKQSSVTELSELRTNYESKLSSAQNELLNAENTILRKSRYILIFIGILIVLSAVFVIIYILLKYDNLRKKEIIYKQQHELMNKELQTVKDAHEINEKELVVNVLKNSSTKELFDNLVQELKVLKSDGQEQHTDKLYSLIKNINSNIMEDPWGKFELHFSKVHNRFYDNLLQAHPDLSPAEKRLCALLLINLSSKEIASITSQTFRSVTTARYRLRLKLNLKHDQNILAYLETFK